MKALEDSVRSIEQEGLVWGASKLVAVGFGIKKLQITLVIGLSSLLHFTTCLPTSITEDELVSLDDLQEKIAEFEDHVQSTDVAAMQSMSWFGLFSRFSFYHLRALRSFLSCCTCNALSCQYRSILVSCIHVHSSCDRVVAYTMVHMPCFGALGIDIW
jgi:translation elongation factor EF-1beta